MGVKGRLRDMSLVDIIQIFNAEHKTAAIHLGSELGYGRVYLEGGEVVHATYRDLAGASAFYHLLSWEDGEFEVEPEARIPEHTIEESSEALILEGLRRLDEERGASRGDRGEHMGDMESIKLVNRLLEMGILEKV